MVAIIQTLIHTPWWVYLLLVYLFYVGIRASKKRVISLKRIMIVPLILLGLSAHTLLEVQAAIVVVYSGWLVAMMFGIVAGWLLVCRYQIKVNHSNRSLEVQGSWAMLVLIIINFVAKYYVNYQLLTHPSLVTNENFMLQMLVISGACTGVLLGRMFCYLYRYKNTESNLSNDHTI